MALAVTVLGWAVGAYLLLLTGRLVLGWLPVLIRGWQPTGALLVVAEVVLILTDPPLRRLARVVKPFRVGDVRIDPGFVALYLVLLLAYRLLTG
ncbi:MAG: YggT family protein [Propionicimonas sp.]